MGVIKGDDAQLVIINGESAFKFEANQSIPTQTSITLTAQLVGGLTEYN